MPLNLATGDQFPDHALVDHAGRTMSIAELADGQPLFVAFYRGPW